MTNTFTSTLSVALALLSGTTLAAQSLIACDSGRKLYRIDRTTGAKTEFGTITSNASTTAGLTYDLLTDTVYLSSTGNDSLFRLDVNTGTATLIGAYGDSTIVMHGIEFDLSTNTLYAVSGSTNNNFYSIDVNTGAATVIGSTGLTSFTNLVYDALNNVMYATNSNTDSFYSIDRATGAVTLIGPLNGPTNPNGLAYELATDTIWLVDNNTDSLYTIDRTTGAATLIGSTGSGNLLGLVELPPTGTYDFFGAGCQGTLGVPGNLAAAAANVGSNWTVNLTNLPFDAAIFMYGLSNTTSPFGPLPFDLTPLGAPGCFARIDVFSSAFIVGSGGVATFNVAVPDAPATFVGFTLYTQGLVFDTVNTFGFTLSDAATAVIGL